uniref:Uncharacterized protein n=1 Tax=Eutreptiella gymnastica TaxID=73025 RepID=A0A7S1NBI2_9EUGL
MGGVGHKLTRAIQQGPMVSLQTKTNCPNRGKTWGKRATMGKKGERRENMAMDTCYVKCVPCNMLTLKATTSHVMVSRPTNCIREGVHTTAEGVHNTDDNLSHHLIEGTDWN